MNRDTARARWDVTALDLDVEEKRHAWRSKLRAVSRNYAALERSIREADAAERAYNLAVRAANLQRTDLGVAVVGALGLLS